MKIRPSPFLSKSKYLDGLKCPKLLWYEYNRKEDFPEVDAATQAIMDQGQVVGELAQTLFPGGIILQRDAGEAGEIFKPPSFASLIRSRFFINSLCLADILNPSKDA